MSSKTDGKDAILTEDNTKVNKANIVAVQITLQALHKRLDDLEKSYKILSNSYQTLQNQYTQFQAQRAIELQERLQNGPTVWHPSEPK